MQMDPQVTPTATLFFPTTTTTTAAYPYTAAPFATGLQPAAATQPHLVHFAADDISTKRMGIIHQIPHHHHHQQILIHPHGGHFILQQIAVPLISDQSATAAATSTSQQQQQPAQTAPTPAAEHLFAPSSGGEMFRFQHHHHHRQPAAHQIIIPAPASASAGAAGFSAKLCQQQTVEINLSDLAHKSFASKSQQRKKKVSPSAKRRSRKRLMAFLEAKRKKECPTISETDGESSLVGGEDKQAFELGEATISMEQRIESSIHVASMTSPLSADDVASTTSSLSSSPPSACDVTDF